MELRTFRAEWVQGFRFQVQGVLSLWVFYRLVNIVISRVVEGLLSRGFGGLGLGGCRITDVNVYIYIYIYTYTIFTSQAGVLLSLM